MQTLQIYFLNLPARLLYLFTRKLLFFKNYFHPFFLFMEIRMDVIDQVGARRRGGFCQPQTGGGYRDFITIICWFITGH